MNRLKFTVDSTGLIKSLNDAEREAQGILNHIREARLTRSCCQVPMALSIGLGEALQREIHCRKFAMSIPRENAEALVRLDYPGVSMLAALPRCHDRDHTALVSLEVAASAAPGANV